MELSALLSKEFNILPAYVNNIISLIDEGATIPFIARYRKELTGSCDDQVLRTLSERLQYLRNLEKRKAEVKESIAGQEKLTDELALSIDNAVTLSEVEDLYRPYRPKRRTRATIAQGKGLRPLADILLRQDIRSGSISQLALPFVDAEKGVETWEDAVAGAEDILAEDMSDDADCRKQLKALLTSKGILVSRGVQNTDSVYQMYYDYFEPVRKIPSHRILAINRGEKEDFLKVRLEISEEEALAILHHRFVRKASVTTDAIIEAAADAFKRLIFPSVEREIRNDLTEKATLQAISMFAVNLKPLLLQPPVRDRVILGLDPAYRTGCKIAVVDGTGKVLDTAVIYPTPPQSKTAEAKRALTRLITQYDVRVISIGNGTASKESEIFVSELIAELDHPIAYMVVSEAGASVYSASKLAALEFPEYDVSLRSAISIARRLLDPLAELVKIDPKAIGIGQYQHDMPPAQLDTALKGVVESCVNSVGVDLNTASASLLTYISGLSEAVAKNIVSYREENGRFHSRKELKKVPKLGPKAFEQCAGFLRIPDGENILDNTSVHPESYDAVHKLLQLFGLSLKDVTSEGITALASLISQTGEQQVSEACAIGLPTLRDIAFELQKPGRDIRDELPPPLLRTDIMKLSDLMPGMELTGTVRNVVDFGAFIDIGVHQDGLVHISALSDRYVRHPSDVVKVGDVITVYVLSVDVAKKRISLSMRKPGS
jgi:uncharacterized protein